MHLILTMSFLKFVELCTRKTVSQSFYHKKVINTIMKHHATSRLLSDICIKRLIHSSKGTNLPPFRCTICQSSTVKSTGCNSIDVITTCLHRFHKGCLENLIEAQPGLNEYTREQWSLDSPLKCPICRCKFDPSHIKHDAVFTDLCIYSSDLSDSEDE